MVGKSSPPSAAKLPATAHGRRTRAAIIDAAAQMMYQKGVAATSLDDILAASSTGKSQLYHYFKDRSELVKAVVERQTELVLAAQPTLTQIDSMDGVEQWAQAILANHDVPGGPFGCPLGSMAAELSQLYHYFKDRSELVKAVVERQTELVLAAQPTLTQIDS
ncbi:TetR/AcrR family transcriptional regulator, partial [Mycobacteroides abscessus subsp. abscessus]|uniref:TetR/AcrR family transcriptional regulator n=1 Tax=Mycobacteroides abscessus TaxID=36809 RepID=UPI0039F0096C